MKPLEKSVMAAIGLGLLFWCKSAVSFEAVGEFATSFFSFAGAAALCAALLVIATAVAEKHRMPARLMPLGGFCAVLLFVPMALVGLVMALIPLFIVASVFAVGAAGQAISRSRHQ